MSTSVSQTLVKKFVDCSGNGLDLAQTLHVHTGLEKMRNDALMSCAFCLCTGFHCLRFSKVKATRRSEILRLFLTCLLSRKLNLQGSRTLTSTGSTLLHYLVTVNSVIFIHFLVWKFWALLGLFYLSIFLYVSQRFALQSLPASSWRAKF